MDLLIDSHIVLYLERSPDSLSAAQLSALQDGRNRIFVSAVTAWELGIKQAKGKLVLAFVISEVIRQRAYRALPVTVEHAERASLLPRLHDDPFDRMLVAQAFVEGLVLVTSDAMLSKYGVTVID